MNKYYGAPSTPMDDYLAHYGVKGMKWGVRKAITTGNEKALNRHFRKAAKKLAKLQDIGLNPKKYAAKSAAYGAAAAGTATVAISGTHGLSSIIRSSAKNLRNKAASAEALANMGNIISTDYSSYKNPAAKAYLDQSAKKFEKADAIDNWGKSGRRTSTEIQNVLDPKTGNVVGYKAVKTNKGLTNNGKLRLGAGIAAAGFGTAALVNGYRAKNYKKYLNKAYEFKNAMDEVFSGTRYEGKYVAPPKKKRKRG